MATYKDMVYAVHKLGYTYSERIETRGGGFGDEGVDYVICTAKPDADCYVVRSALPPHEEQGMKRYETFGATADYSNLANARCGILLALISTGMAQPVALVYQVQKSG